MHDLTVEEIIAIHRGIMERDGGDARILSEGNLHQTIFQVNLHTDPFARAATTIYLLCAYKAFRDGNRRTARAVAETILADAGYTLPDDNSRCSALMQGVVDFSVDLEEIEEHFRHSAVMR